mgnify:FL=1
MQAGSTPPAFTWRDVMLREWITNIIVCGILFSVILYLVPDPKMKKYIQTAIGFVMMIVVLTPVIRWLHSDDRVIFDMYEESLGANIDGGDDEVYVELMEKVIQDFISDRYGTYADVDIELSDEMEIAGIRVILSGDNPMEGENAQTGKQIDHGEADPGEMSKVLSDEYGLDQEKISIARRAGK